MLELVSACLYVAFRACLDNMAVSAAGWAVAGPGYYGSPCLGAMG